jgi:hypothetical protein
MFRYSELSDFFLFLSLFLFLLITFYCDSFLFLFSCIEQKNASSSSSGKSLKDQQDGHPPMRSSSQVLIKKPLLKTLNLAKMKLSDRFVV